MNLQSFVKEGFNTNIGIKFDSTLGHKQTYLHWHPHYEVMLILSGRYTVTNHYTDYYTEKPTLYIYRPYTLHKVNANSGAIYSRYILHIGKSVLSQFPPTLLDMSIYTNITMLRADPNQDELNELQYLCNHIMKNLHDARGNALSAAMILHRAEQILSSGRGEVLTSKFSYIQDVLQLVSDSISEPLTIPQLCEKFGIGHSKLLKDFKDTTGTTYKKYITDLRQTRARELLDSGSSIVSASLEVGYSSEAHFIKAFREYWGITPGDYLKSHKI